MNEPLRLQLRNNEEILVEFSEPVDITSFNKATFRLQDENNGDLPDGSYLLDPSNPRRVIYRPLLSFNSDGSPSFGLTEGAVYSITIAGADKSPPPYVTSMSGKALGRELRCTVTASGINDPVAGPPQVTVLVETIRKDAFGNPILDPITGLPLTESGIPADNATDVFRDSDIVLEFNDIMNPATLVNPVTGQSPSIQVFIDPDGDITDSSDQVEIFGSFVLTVFENLLRTRVTFTPAQSFPSAGSSGTPRRIVVLLPNTILDLGNNPISNTNRVSFVPEVLTFTQEILPDGGEQFVDQSNRDARTTGAVWENGELRPGAGGGSGRLGRLELSAGEILTLYTDGLRPKPLDDGAGNIVPGEFVPGEFWDQVFGPEEIVRNLFNMAEMAPELEAPMPISGARDSQNVATVLLDNYDPMATRAGTGTYVVRDGIYEFDSVRIPPGALVRFVGPNVPRVYSRGEFAVEGRIEVAGRDGGQHGSQTEFGGEGGLGGPGGGQGGAGGDQPPALNDLITVAVGLPHTNPKTDMELDGKDGEGVLVPAAMVGDPPTMEGGGMGGVHFPTVVPDMTTIDGTATFGPICTSNNVGGAGSGAGHAFDGVIGVASSEFGRPALPPNSEPPDTGGGSMTVSANPADPARELTPEAGFLTGGAGGGGGGGHIAGSQKTFPACALPSATIVKYVGHSGAGGGGGGGAIQLQAGSRLVLDGQVDASGGKGGDSAPITDPNLIEDADASPGGGGAGGSVLLQGQAVQVSNLPGRVDISGGEGGEGIQDSFGGAGSTGLLRIESGLISDGTVPILEEVADGVLPFDPADRSASADFISVDEFLPIKIDEFIPGDDPLTLQPIEFLPGSFSGARSCWMRPSGNFFSLEFLADEPGEPGWTMDVLIGTPPTVVPYRGTPGDPGYENTTEGFFADPSQDGLVSAIQNVSEGISGSPIIVRFQGARAISEIDNLCNVNLEGPGSPIQPGSVTPWVLHPSELNTYWSQVFPSQPGEVSKRQPNLIRFQIVFNRFNPVAALVRGVTNVRINVQPD